MIAVAYLAVMIDRQWVADDEGLLGQTAERVLRGEAPHRDFGDMYTGGQAYLHALAFKLAGVSLLVLRYTLLLFAAAWIPAVYAVAARLATPAAAVPLTALAIVWSIPNYAAPMPSWYNLFFATFGLAAILRFVDTGGRGWIVAAGIAGGVSFLFKITGAFYVAGVLLFLLVRAPHTADPATRPVLRWSLPAGWAVLAAFVLGLVKLIAPVASAEHVFHFVLPGTALAVVAGAELRRAGGLTSTALRSLCAETSLFLGGVAVPVALYAGTYAATGDLGALLEAWFLAPTARYQNAAFPPLSLPVAVPAALVLLLAAAFASRRARVARVATGIMVLLPAFLWVVTGPTWFYRILWVGLAQSTPLVVVAGAAVLLRRQSLSLDPGVWERLFLALSLAGLCSLIQIPFAAPIYFCYTAPLTLLAAAALWRALGAPRSTGLGSLMLGYTVFAVVWLNGHGVDELGLNPPAAERLVRLPQERAKLRVPARDERIYTALIDTLQRHARGGYTFAAPEAPEVYYLTGLHNPTRALFEFTEQYEHAPEATVRLLDRHGITAVAINRDPKFSPPLSPELLALLARAYPDSAPIGKFLVRWTQ
jgi:hypothetical protein